jgi:hypothetical protein
MALGSSLHFDAGIAIMRARSSGAKEEAPVAKRANDGFDPKAFLAKVGAGKTILKLAKNKHVFEQGDVADTVFYIQKAGSSSLFCPSMVRKR